MSSTFYSLLTGQSFEVCPRMELHNLPYVVLRELLPMIGIKDKQTLRLVSHRHRDLIDTQRNVQFNVILSDATSSIVLKFNNFDLIFLPRILHQLNVTTLLAPLKLSSMSSTRCPLPPVINTLSFKETRGISQDNFILLVNFYGKTDSLKTIKANMLCLEKIHAKILERKILELNMVENLELVFPPSMDVDVECAMALLEGNLPSLKTLKIDLNPYGCYHIILYKQAFFMISNHLPGLSTLEVIQPERYYAPHILPQLETVFPERVNQPFVPHIGDLATFNQVLEIGNNVDFDMTGYEELGEKFEQGCESLKKLTMGFSMFESMMKTYNIGRFLVNCQKKLEILELTWPCLPIRPPAVDTVTAFYSGDPVPLNLPKILNNCSPTLVTLKLMSCVLDTADDYSYVDPALHDYQFNLAQLENCSRLQTFMLTWSHFDVRPIGFSNVDKLPQSLRHLELPSRVLEEDLRNIRRRLSNLKTFTFGKQMPPVTLPQFQILMENEGMPNLEQVTLIEGFYESGPIEEWANDPQNGITVTKIKENFAKILYEFQERDIAIFKKGA